MGEWLRGIKSWIMVMVAFYVIMKHFYFLQWAMEPCQNLEKNEYYLRGKLKVTDIGRDFLSRTLYQSAFPLLACQYLTLTI